MPRRRSMPFLPRSGYRLRRLHDAARLLPLFGLFLLVLPVLWSPAGDDLRRTASDGIYLFAVWIGLIAVAAVFARRLGRAHEDPAAVVTEPGAAEGSNDAL